MSGFAGRHLPIVLLDASELSAAATRGRDPLSGTLRLGVIPTIAPYLLPDIVPAIAEKYPKLKLVFREAKTEDVMRDLREGR